MGLRHRLAVLEQRLRSFGRRPRRAEPAAQRRKPLFEILEQRLLLSVDLIGIPTWAEQGPGPMQSAQVNVPPGNFATGAVESIAINPNNTAQIYVGTVNGGVWRTNNANPASPDATTWTPLTDQQASLAMGDVAFSPLDATGNTLFAGTGSFSSLGQSGGPAIGVLRTTDGGATWNTFALNPGGGENQVKTVLPTAIDLDAGAGVQEMVLVGTVGGGGLYRSNDNGQTYTLLSGANGLPAGDISQLIVDSNNTQRFYAGVPNQGVFRGDFNAGTGVITWAAVNTNITGIGTAGNVQIAGRNSGGTTVLFALLSGPSQGAFRSTNSGDTWTPLAAPPALFQRDVTVRAGNTIVVDPTNDQVVYIATYGGGNDIFRYNPAGSGSWDVIDNAGAQGGTAPHADARDLAFQGTNVLVEVCDGGIYFIQNPLDSINNAWHAFIGGSGTGLRDVEFHNVAWDSRFDVIVGGSQDNGTEVQLGTGNLVWDHFNDGDGGDVQVDAVTLSGASRTIRYVSSQNMDDLSRVVFDSATNIVQNVAILPGGGLANFSGPFVPHFEVNALDPAAGQSKSLVVGGGGTSPVYVATMPAAVNSNADVTWTAVPVAAGFGTVNALAFGGRSGGTDNPDVLYAGTENGLFVRTTAGGTLNATGTAFPGGGVSDVTLDPNDWRHAFVTSSSGVWETTDTGANWTNRTGNLSNSNIQTVEYAEQGAVDAILVGGLGGVFRMITDDPGDWHEYGQFVPNAVVYDLDFDAVDNVVIAGTLGRGAWKITNASNTLTTPGLVRINGDPDGDVIELRRRATDAGLLDVFFDGALASTVLWSAIEKIEVNSAGGDDLLIANLINGDVIPDDHVDYDGGIGDDELDIRNATFGTVTYAIAGPISGSVQLGASDVVDYDFVQQVTDRTAATNRIFNFTGADESIRIDDDGSANGLTRVDSPAGDFAIHDVANPGSTLTINAGGGADHISLLGTDAAFAATVNLNAGPGTDTIAVNFGTQANLVHVDGGTGTDSLTVNGTALADVLVLTPTAITRNGSQTVTYLEIEDLILDAGNGNDDITVNGTGPVTTILGGDGDDDFHLLASGPNPLTLDGQGGSDDYALEIGGITGLVTIADTGPAGDTDTLLVNGTPFDDTIVLTDLLITFAGGSVSYSGIETLTVDAKAGNDLVDGSALTRDITIIGGEGNDTLLSGSGADTLEGGPGDDHMEGGDGGDRYVFAGLLLGIDTIFEFKADTGIDVLDFSMFGAAIVLDLRRHDAQVVSPGNLTLTLEECEAIEDVIGSPFGNTLHGNSGPNHLVGGGAVDVLHGEGGDDWLEGLGGDDELYGEEGSDLLDGGADDDVILGDRGIVKTVVDALGTHKEVLLVDQAMIVGDRAISQSKPFDAGLMDDELLLLVGAKDAKGKFETRLLSLDLLDAGDDTILGGDGADLMFGQRGADLLQGAAGDDYAEGNEGDDEVHGGTDDDVLIGDNSYHFLPTEGALPVVAHGFEIVDGPPEPCEVPPQGPTLVPLAALTPAGVHSIEPLGAALYEGARDLAVLPTLPPLIDAKGRTLIPFASIIPDVPRHLDLIAGNDELFGDAGADRLIGDHSAIIAPFQSGLAGMIGDLEHAMERLALAERILPPHPVVVPAVASDILHGGDDDDVLVGDISLTLVGTAATTGALPAGLEQAADDFDDGVTAFVAKLKGKPTPIGFTTSQDQLFGESGDDRLVGDHTVTIAVAIDGPAGSTVQTDWLAKVKLPSLTVGGAKDMLDGGIGDDELVGDSDVAVIAGVGVSPFDDIADAALPAAGELESEQLAISGNHTQRVAPLLPAVQVGSGTGTGYHTIATGRVVDTLTVRGAQDVLTGGSGDDLEVGDGRVQVAAYVQGPFATLDPGVKHPDRQLVRIGSLVGTVGLEGSEDRLAGNDGDDTLIGDAAATIAGVFSGPALLIGAGQAIARPKVTQHDEELVHFTGLVDLLRAQGAFDVLEGGGGDDALVGDHQVLVSGVVAGPVLEGLPAATGFTSDHRFETAVEFSELLGTLDLCGGGDSLFGGDGDDELVGDSATVIAGILREGVLAGPAAFVAQAAFQHPYREALVDFDGLVGCISSSGSPDELYGGDGDDALAGDDQLVVAGVIHGNLVVVAGPGTAALPAKKTQDTALVEFDGLLGSAELCGAMDWLFGGEGDDLAAGDHRLLVLGVQDGAVVHGNAALAGAIAAAQGRLSGEAQVDFDHLVDCITLRGDDDTLDGGAGDDHLLGDHLATVKALAAGPLLVTAAPPVTGLPSSPASGEWLVEFEGFVGSLELRGGADALAGGDGEDRLTGDSATEVAAVIEGTLHDGFGGTLLPGPTAPAELRLLRFEPLVGSIADYGGKDTLAGGRDADELNGDSALGIHQVIASDGATPPLFPPLFAHVRTEGLVDKATLYGERDQLTGGDGDDCLAGDHIVHVATVLEGEQPGDAVRITVAKLANSLTLKGADDRLDGAAGDDHLAGDSNIAVTGLALPDGASLGNRVIEIESALGNLRAEGGCDTLTGGDGEDIMLGDNAAVLTGVAFSGGFAPAVGAVHIVEVGTLVCDVDVVGSRDTLDGGRDGDTLYGGNHLTLAAASGNLDAGTALRVEVGKIAPSIDVTDGQDKLTGGDGGDRLFGDNRIEAAAFAGTVAAGAEIDVEVHGMVDCLLVKGGDDQAWGNAGDDLLVGDNQLVVAGMVLTAAIDGEVEVDVDGGFGRITLEGGCDSLDGGDGADTLIGDHLAAIGAVLDPESRPASAGATGEAEIDVESLIERLELKSGDDKLYGGAGGDLLLGDSHATVAAFLGAFATPIALSVDVSGTRLVGEMDVRAGCDTLRGGIGDDVLVGDSDVLVALVAGGPTGPAGSYAMTKLIENLTVAAASDNLNGEAGTNVLEHGNRVTAPPSLVKKSSLSSVSKTLPPATPPVIDWLGGLCGADAAAPAGGSGWRTAFVTVLGQTERERNPNAAMRVVL